MALHLEKCLCTSLVQMPSTYRIVAEEGGESSQEHEASVVVNDIVVNRVKDRIFTQPKSFDAPEIDGTCYKALLLHLLNKNFRNEV